MCRHKTIDIHKIQKRFPSALVFLVRKIKENTNLFIKKNVVTKSAIFKNFVLIIILTLHCGKIILYIVEKTFLSLFFTSIQYKRDIKPTY